MNVLSAFLKPLRSFNNTHLTNNISSRIRKLKSFASIHSVSRYNINSARIHSIYTCPVSGESNYKLNGITMVGKFKRQIVNSGSFTTQVLDSNSDTVSFLETIDQADIFLNGSKITKTSILDFRKGVSALILESTESTLSKVVDLGLGYKIPEWLSKSVYWLAKGEAVAIPTETVYGLAANALSESAVKKIYKAKARPSDNPLIVHVSSLEMLVNLYKSNPDKSSEVSDSEFDLNVIPKIYHQLAYQFWPGPLTIVLPRPKCIPDIVLGYNTSANTVAFRLPSHNVARAVIELSGLPLAAPSANSSGLPSPTLAKHVFSDLNSLVPLIVDGGACQVGLESTVIDAISTTLPTITIKRGKFESQIDQYNSIIGSADVSTVRIPCILRPGAITIESIYNMIGKTQESVEINPGEPISLWELTKIYGKSFNNKTVETAPTTPGMKYRHYSPLAKVMLFVPPKQNTRDAAAFAASGNEPTKAQIVKTLNNLSSIYSDDGLRKIQKIGVIFTGSGYNWISLPKKKYNLMKLIYDLKNHESIAMEELEQSENLVSDGTGNENEAKAKSGNKVTVIFCSTENILNLGSSMFGLLRLMDELKVELIMVEGVSEENEGLAIMNRLNKAASAHIQC